MNIITCHDLYSSPEFIAFARKIGIPWEQGVRNLLIIMPMDGVVQVLMDFQGSPPEEAAARKRIGDEILARSGLVGDPPQIVYEDRIDTTTEHNQLSRTWLSTASRACNRCKCRLGPMSRRFYLAENTPQEEMLCGDCYRSTLKKK